MKRKHRIVSRWAVISILAAGLIGMGTAYGYWTDRLNLTAALKTGNFGLQFGAAEQCRVTVQQIGSPPQALPGVTAIPAGDGRVLTLEFADGLPAGFLQGAYLVVEYPLAQPEAGGAPVAEKQEDFSAPDAGAVLTAETPVFRINEAEYPLKVCPAQIPAALAAEVYQKVAYDADGRPQGTLYLALTTEAQSAVTEAQKTENEVFLTEEMMTAPLPESAAGKPGELVVPYRMQLPLAFTQGG